MVVKVAPEMCLIHEEEPRSAMSQCPGTSSEGAGRASACSGCPNQSVCASGTLKQPDPSLPLISSNLDRISLKLLVMSGKGGVGKSTMCAAIAEALQASGRSVAVLDVDLCGPSQAVMLGCPPGSSLHSSSVGLSPVYTDSGIAVVSMAFLLSSPDTAVIWRGDRKTSMIRQFLRDVDWGDADVLLVDTPPGTSDEHLALAQMFTPCRALLVTTPQEVAWQDVRKQVDFCRKTGIAIAGVIENMTGPLQCAHCGHAEERLFSSVGIEQACKDIGVPHLGRVLVDQALAMSCDDVELRIRDSVRASVIGDIDDICSKIIGNK